MSTLESAAGGVAGASPFAGQYICAVAGLRMTPGATGPVFEQDVWDFKDVEGFPRSMPGDRKIFDGPSPEKVDTRSGDHAASVSLSDSCWCWCS